MAEPIPSGVVRSRTSEMEAQTESKAASNTVTEQEQPKAKPSLLRRSWQRFKRIISYKHPYPFLGFIFFLNAVDICLSIARLPFLALMFNVDNSGHKFAYWYLILNSLMSIINAIITRPRQWSHFSTWYREEYRLWFFYRIFVIGTGTGQLFADLTLRKASRTQFLMTDIIYVATLWRWVAYSLLPESMKKGQVTSSDGDWTTKRLVKTFQVTSKPSAKPERSEAS